MDESEGKSMAHRSLGPTMSITCFVEHYGLWAFAAVRNAESVLSPLIAGAYRIGILCKACLSFALGFEGG